MAVLGDADGAAAGTVVVPHGAASGGLPTRSVGARQEFIATPDGVAISVWEWGNPHGPAILFIHGLAQCYLSFSRQFESELAETFRLVAYDLRGHGDLAKPLDAAFYQDGQRWADEVAAVIAAKRLERPVLVGWSLGGRVLREYLVHHGDRELAGINIVSSRPIEDPSILAPASRANLAGQPPDLAGRIRASAAFLRACFHRQPSEEEFAFALAYNMLLPREVREAVAGWTPDLDAIRTALAKVSVPTLVTHGLADGLILPAAAEMTLAAIRYSRGSFYPDCGHSPFYEDAERFNRELREFAAAATRGSAAVETASHGHRR